MDKQLKPLWRKARKAHNDHRPFKESSSRQRNTKKGMRSSMTSYKKTDVDFTPLYKYLITQIGNDYDEVYSYAVKRIPDNCKEQIDYLFVTHLEKLEGKTISTYVRLGESSYWSKLFIDDDNKIQMLDPTLTINHFYPSCSCCVHTFNGEEIVNKFDMGKRTDFLNKTNITNEIS